MKFSDTIYAAAMFLLCYVLLFVPLHQAIGFTTFLIPNSIIVACLLSGLITGMVFATKLVDQRARSIGKILLVCSTLIVFFVFTSNVVDWTAYKEIYQTTMNAAQWSQDMVLRLYIAIALYEVFGLTIAGLGLYVGSVLRRIKAK